MKLLCAYANLRPETKLRTIGKCGGSIYINSSSIYLV